MPKFTLPVEKIDLEDSDIIGKGFSNLSFVKNSQNAKIPNCFFVTSLAFEETLKPFKEDITKLLLVNNLSIDLIDKTKQLLANRIKLDSELETEIKKRVKLLNKPYQVNAVLILPNNQLETEVFSSVVNSEKDLFETINSAYLSFLHPQYLKKLLSNGDFDQTTIALMISEKLFPEVSGNVYNDLLNQGKLRIQSGWGEFQKNFVKDVSLINKVDLSESSYVISQQKTQIAYIKGSYKSLVVSKHFQNQRKLSLENAQLIAQETKKIETKTLGSVNIHFSIFKDKVYFTKIESNSTPVQILKETVGSIISLPLVSSLKPIFPGIASGLTKIISKKKDLAKLRLGEIAVINSVEKESLPFLRKAGGVIINSSQNLKKSQEALIKKLGISSALGNFIGTQNSLITLDSRSGKLYRGAFRPLKNHRLEVFKKIEQPDVLRTATKIFATIPYSTTKISLDLSEADGIGPINLDGFSIKTRKNTFDFLVQVCQKADGKTVIVNLSQKHPNPKEYLLSQAELIKELRNKSSFKNLSIVLSDQKIVSDLLETKKLISSVGLHRSQTFKVFLSIETSANIFSLKEFIDTGIDGLVIDYWSLVNNLYQENFPYSELINFDDSAIYNSLESIFEAAKKHRVFTLLSNFPIEKSSKLSSKLVPLSVKALSTSWQNVTSLRSEIADSEKDFLKNKR